MSRMLYTSNWVHVPFSIIISTTKNITAKATNNLTCYSNTIITSIMKEANAF